MSYNDFDANNLPSQYRPLGAWAYFGYMILFSIPVIGFILLIVFSFNNSNINRRNFARSYWCIFLLIAPLISGLPSEFLYSSLTSCFVILISFLNFLF